MNKIVPIFPWPMHEKVADVINAVPGITPVPALPGGPGPVLAIRKAPPFAADAVVVMTPDRVPEAVRIVLGDGIQLVTVAASLERLLGTEPGAVVEIEESK